MAHIQAATGSHPLEVPDVTVSVGVASFPDHASATEALVKAADDAMYVAKREEKEKVYGASSTVLTTCCASQS